eukprot:TRINITY_DN15324_c0_g1_i1.p1 TRINITY_DN15324_c0_g1~~TRINITY_DN15324_c0_g1_i1.p1  ORF type:complete len:174 (-),score=36.69 TRINITY_DN15324_c0_g1_i1:108-629(-)
MEGGERYPVRVVVRVPGKRPSGGSVSSGGESGFRESTKKLFWDGQKDDVLWKYVSQSLPHQTDWPMIAAQLHTSVENCIERSSELYKERLSFVEKEKSNRTDPHHFTTIEDDWEQTENNFLQNPTPFIGRSGYVSPKLLDFGAFAMQEGNTPVLVRLPGGLSSESGGRKDINF